MLKEKTILISEKAKALINDAKKLTTSMLTKSGINSFGDLDDEDTLMIRDSMKLVTDCYDFAELQAKQMDQINKRLDDIMDKLEKLEK